MLGKKCSEELEGEIFFVARFLCFLYTGCEIKHQHWLLAIFETMFQSKVLHHRVFEKYD